VLIELPTAWELVLNIGLWPVIQLALAVLFTNWPLKAFSDKLVRASPWSERFYERVLLIRIWKDRLPDGARWLGGGFTKGRLSGSNPDYIRQFIRSTRAGEMCHEAAIAFTPLFFIWNPWWADAVMVAYALVANLPCILVQRYNRGRLSRLLRRQVDDKRS
jgi:glycosyl-4,4'-diaponeurosporenoate acyltransferase